MEPTSRNKTRKKFLIGGLIFFTCSIILFYWLVFMLTVDKKAAIDNRSESSDGISADQLQAKFDTFLDSKQSTRLVILKKEVGLITKLLPNIPHFQNNMELAIENKKLVAQIHLPLKEISSISYFPFLGNRFLNGKLIFSIRKFDKTSWVLHLENFLPVDGKSFALNYFIITEKMPKEWANISGFKVLNEGIVIEK